MEKSIGEDGRDEDRLSSLPDEILTNILSHLPTKTAVAASVLSPRWPGLWTQIDSLEFDSYHFKEKDPSSIFTIIDQVVNQITSPFISKFILHLNDPCFFELQSSDSSDPVTYLESCLRQLCVRNIKQIQINPLKRSTLQCSIVKLPPFVFQTPSLVVLELGPLFTYKLPTYCDGKRFHLPNLNKLKIYLSERCLREFSNLIRSCPSLEDLSFSIVSHNEDACLNISSQSLKQLHIIKSEVNININAPKLVKFNVSFPDDLKIRFVTNPIALFEATITHIQTCIPSKTYLIMAKLFKGISSVTYLVLHSDFQFSNQVRFPNLTHLTWTVTSLREFELVLDSLQICPALEVLILKVEYWKQMTRWVPPSSVPACVSTHLKRIELNLNETISGESLLQVVKYLLSSARILEQLVINMTMLVRQYDKVICRKEEQLCKQLYELPRSLSQCQIVFSGIYFNARVPNSHIVKPSTWEEFHWIND